MFKFFLGVVVIVFLFSILFAFGMIDFGNLNPNHLLSHIGNMFNKQSPDIRGDIVSGSIKAREIEGDIKGGKGIEAEKITGDITGGEDITANELYGDITNGSNIDLDAMVGDITGGKDIKVDTLVGDISGGENMYIRVLIGEDKTSTSTDTIRIDRIIEKETIIKEIC
ncbi:hypothetical protein KO317_00460 [Candidatus Micrarchaeota archaeon]|nr:hypothetical protein [Candidatus Micrarchaeota archaeon]